MSKWNLIMDVERCTNCNNCFMTNKDEYVGNTFEGYSAPQPRHGHKWIQIDTRERGAGSQFDVAYLVTTCNQCDNAPCIKAAQNNAVTKRADGIVIIDPVKAKGQKQLVAACPYGHIWWNEDLNLPQKWSWDAHLLDQGWTSPRSEQVCATGAFKAKKCPDAEMAAYAAQEKLEILRPELNTKPRVWYKNLHRFNKDFIAGSVAKTVNGLEECVAGATVTLKKNGKDIAQKTTDYFGDFKFDALAPNSGEYELSIAAEGATKSLTHNLTDSVYLGAIMMD